MYALRFEIHSCVHYTFVPGWRVPSTEYEKKYTVSVCPTIARIGIVYSEHRRAEWYKQCNLPVLSHSLVWSIQLIRTNCCIRLFIYDLANMARLFLKVHVCQCYANVALLLERINRYNQCFLDIVQQRDWHGLRFPQSSMLP